MQPCDREKFVPLAQAMFAAFDKPQNDARLEAYWRGLTGMNLLAFERVVDHVVGPDGEDELPSPKMCHAIARRLQREARANATPIATTTTREFDVFEQHGNRVLLSLLRQLTHDHGSGATEESLAEMLHVKQIWVDGYRQNCETEPEASLELRDKLIEKLTPLFVPRDPPVPPVSAAVSQLSQAQLSQVAQTQVAA